MVLRICVVGFKNTGKTKLITSMVKTLSSMGLRTVVVKHSYEKVDLASKDTARIMALNPLAVAYQSPYDKVLILNSDSKLELFIELLNPHVIIYEGFKKSPYPKILTALEQSQLKIGVEPQLVKMVVAHKELKEAALKLYPEASFSQPDDENLMDTILQVLRKVYSSNLPGLNCRRCGYSSCGDYAEKLMKGEAELGRCVVENPPAKIYVDWFRVNLTAYPTRVLKNLLEAFVNSLKGVKKSYEHIVASAYIRDEGRGESRASV